MLQKYFSSKGRSGNAGGTSDAISNLLLGDFLFM